ncbi:MAG: hypothetical protein JSS66_05585 [Armatimonadetes bacterium]|nr:hypothetical protein [Armatimonadota bacterium]
MTSDILEFVSQSRAGLVQKAQERTEQIDTGLVALRAILSLAVHLDPQVALEATRRAESLVAEREAITTALAAMPVEPAPVEETAAVTTPVKQPEQEEAAPPEPEKKPSGPPVRPPRRPGAPPATQPVPDKSAVRKRLEEEMESVFCAVTQRTQELCSLATVDADTYFGFKVLIADARAAHSQAVAGGLEGVKRVDDAIGELTAWHTAHAKDLGPVKGLEALPHVGYEGWTDLSAAYTALQQAVRTWCALEADDFANANAPRIAVLCMGAATHFVKVAVTHRLDLYEPEQDALKKSLDLAMSAGKVQYKKSRFEFAPLDAKQLGQLFEDGKTAVLTAAEREKHLDMLKAALEDKPGACELLRLVNGLLSLGMPPSDKSLRAMLAPYREMLPKREGKGQYFRLVDYLAQDALLAKVSAPKRESVKPAPSEVVESVIEFTRGKKMLFLGGRTDPLAQKSLVDALELQELDWPTTDKTTNLNKLLPHVPSADIVVLLTRFCRHAYKEVLDAAKAQGKHTVVLPGGLGVNNVASNIKEQCMPLKVVVTK